MPAAIIQNVQHRLGAEAFVVGRGHAAGPLQVDPVVVLQHHPADLAVVGLPRIDERVAPDAGHEHRERDQRRRARARRRGGGAAAPRWPAPVPRQDIGSERNRSPGDDNAVVIRSARAGFPSLSLAGSAVPASIFARLREHLARFPGDVIPLQIGDTHLPPADPAPRGRVERSGGSLRVRRAGRLGAAGRRDRRAERGAHVQIAVGATHALSCAVQAIVRSGRRADPPDAALAADPRASRSRTTSCRSRCRTAISRRSSARSRRAPPRSTTRLRTTPTARCSARRSSRAIARARRAARAVDPRRRGLRALRYDAPHASMLGIAPARDDRGVLVREELRAGRAARRLRGRAATSRTTDTLRKLVNHSVYNVPVATQRAALGGDARRRAVPGGRTRALSSARAIARSLGSSHRRRRRRAARICGSTSRDGPPGDCMPVLEKLAAAGVLLAPGHAFGDACHASARLCFTGVAEARLDEGIDRINAVLASWS